MSFGYGFALPRTLGQPGAGGGAFSPADLTGLISWHEARNIAGNGQTSAGPGSIVQGDPIGYTADMSGNSRHATQATSSRRPVLEKDAGGRWVYRLLANTELGLITGNIDLTAFTKVNVFIGASNANSTVTTKTAFSLRPATGQGHILITTPSTALRSRLTGTGTAEVQKASGPALNTAFVLCSVNDLAGATAADEIIPQVNGDPTGWAVFTAGPAGTGNFANAPLCIGNWSPGTFNFAWQGDIYAVIVVAGDMTAGEILSTQEYIAGLSGVPLPFDYEAVTFADTGAQLWQATGEYWLASSYATLSYQTTATSADVRFYTNSGIGNDFDSIGVFVDGAYNQTISTSTTPGNYTTTISLPPGDKLVTLVNSEWFHNGANVPLGSFVKRLVAPGKVEVVPSAGNRILFYGDSIIGGGHADPIHQFGLQKLMRGLTANSVAFESASGRPFRDDALDGTKRAAFVAKLVAYNPAVIWLAIGVNDYGQGLWNATDFGTAYAATLDAINAALPGVPIYAQSPTLRNATDTANAVGSTLANYRAAIVTACTGRAFATYVNGLDIITSTSDLADTVHPNNAGNATYAAFLASELAAFL